MNQNSETTREVRELVQEFFSKMDFPVQVQEVVFEESTARVQTSCEEFRTIIGEGGQTLGDIQYILNLLARRKFEERMFLDLDVAGYKEKKREYLRDLAGEAADEVALTKKEKSLLPMRPYERRIIHTILSEREDVVTESAGEGSERHVVIRPA